MNLLYISSSRIGDAVLATGILKHFIDQYPGIKVTIATDPLPAPLFQRVPNLQRLITFEKRPHKKHWLFLWRQLAQTRWDIIVDLRGSVVPMFLRAGKRYIWNSRGKSGHQVEKISQCIHANAPVNPFIWLDEIDHQTAETVLNLNNVTPDNIIPNIPILALAPAANWRGKQWPAEYFAHAIGTFLQQKEAKVALFAAPHEKEMLSPIIQNISQNQRIDLIGKIDLLTVAACLKKARLFLGNDSGLMHLSAAVGTPTIGLFGPTNDAEYGPWGPKNTIIRTPESLAQIRQMDHFSYDQRDLCYMESLSVDCVLETLTTMWEKEK